MMTLIKNIDCLCPRRAGPRDILIAADKICAMAPPGSIPEAPFIETVIDGHGLRALPGFVDQHMHLAGGGGEAGFESRTAGPDIGEIFAAGITTAVGLLGADGVTRSMGELYAAAKALEAGGLTTYMYSGSYAVPPVTLTGSLMEDILFVDKVIGCGEIAVSDHRSSNPGPAELGRLAADAYRAGLLSGKAGVLHLHVGDGKKGLAPVFGVLSACDVPADRLVPTHVNRSAALLRQALSYCRRGGVVDLTAGETAGVCVTEAVAALIAKKVPLERITVSSDAGGSVPSGGAARPGALYSDFVEIISRRALPAREALRLFTENPARRLGLYPKKGALQPGGDADILVTDRAYRIKMVYAMGRPVLGAIG